MKRPEVYIAGVDVHAELADVLGTKKGWAGIDLAVITRDLPGSNLDRPGMGELILEATGVSMRHIKHPDDCPEWQRFKYIRQDGWEKEELCDEKTVYAALGKVEKSFSFLRRLS